MIILLNPRATKPKNRRYPLSVLAIAAVLEGKEEYTIVDGNVETLSGADPWSSPGGKEPELLAVTVMPGPQMVSAIPLCRAFKTKYSKVPIVWGGYFPSLYPDTCLNAGYVDFVVRGQGEHTFIELLAALRGARDFSKIRGLCFRDQFGLHVHNPERPLQSPGDFPLFPYHRLDPANYLLPTFLGSRTTVHQSSIGCPFRCNFCGVVPIFDREKIESPERTAGILSHLQREYGVNAVQFYDNNFFLREDHTRELAERMAPLGMRWWCEGRVDTVLSYSDETLRKLRQSGCVMIFFGVESGSDEILRGMRKQLKSEQILALAKRIREFDIVPEYSFIFGNPDDAERDLHATIRFIRKVKQINPDIEIVVQTYVPTPQRDGTYGKVDGKIQFPSTPEEWATERWFNFTIRTDPQLPWLPRRVKRRIDDFETVMRSRWPTIQDMRLPAWGRVLLQSLSSWRYAWGVYDYPIELEWAQKMIKLRQPRFESL
jgi:anaerobic magnesium-protoporphyrin IX monomethyl ester cyclase